MFFMFLFQNLCFYNYAANVASQSLTIRVVRAKNNLPREYARTI